MELYKSVGIKQVIRYEWLKYTVELLLSGHDSKQIRAELTDYLTAKKGSGTEGDRAGYTLSLAVNNIMNIWVTPRDELIPLRDDFLALIKNNDKCSMVCHWSMFAAAYPFWYNLSYIFGSLFRLQNQIKKGQIMSRMYELLGEKYRRALFTLCDTLFRRMGPDQRP
jgi:hypothetical protein